MGYVRGNIGIMSGSYGVYVDFIGGSMGVILKRVEAFWVPYPGSP